MVKPNCSFTSSASADALDVESSCRASRAADFISISASERPGQMRGPEPNGDRPRRRARRLRLEPALGTEGEGIGEMGAVTRGGALSRMMSFPSGPRIRRASCRRWRSRRMTGAAGLRRMVSSRRRRRRRAVRGLHVRRRERVAENSSASRRSRRPTRRSQSSWTAQASVNAVVSSPPMSMVSRFEMTTCRRRACLLSTVGTMVSTKFGRPRPSVGSCASRARASAIRSRSHAGPAWGAGRSAGRAAI